MTPDDYRGKMGLAPDYPMVAPNYAAQRSGLRQGNRTRRGAGRASGRRPAGKK